MPCDISDLKLHPIDFSIVKTLDITGLMYYSKHSEIVCLYNILGEKAELFFNMFGGIDLHFPRMDDEDKLRKSHIPEIGVYFGRDILLALYEKFGEGSTIKVPPSKRVNFFLTELVLYSKVKKARDTDGRIFAKHLASQYSIPILRIRQAYDKIIQG